MTIAPKKLTVVPPAFTAKDVTESTQNFSAGINKTIDEAAERVHKIEADQAHDAAEKSSFITRYKPKIEREIAAQMKALEQNLAVHQRQLENSVEKSPALSTAGSILLATKLKESRPLAMPELAASDPRYAALLEELPPSFFGIDKKFHAELLGIARKLALTEEQVSRGATLENDAVQLRFLKSRSGALFAKMDVLLLNETDQAKREKTAHLYG